MQLSAKPVVVSWCVSLFALVALAPLGVAQAAQFNVLVFSKTAGWHHDSIPSGVAAIEQLGKLHDFTVMWTEDPKRVINDTELKKYQVVVFLQTTGDILDGEQRVALERYIKAGGGYVGVHSASDTEYGWPWYRKMVGHMFRAHPPIQTAVLKVEDRDFPGMERFAKRALFTDEWYEFTGAESDQLHYLLSVDESTYKPQQKSTFRDAKGRNGFHPVSWYQSYDGGRAFYTALGHLPATYSDQTFLHHLYGGIYWAATGNGFKAE
jgi:type 1 glutamine amidotransferase